MTDATRPRNEVLKKLSQDWKKVLKCDWLPGDASNRFYGRIRVEGIAENLMLMVMNAPEAFKSEEVTGADEKAVVELPFVSIARQLEKEGIRVPHIHYVDPRAELLVSEDLGAEQLYDRRQRESAYEWYRRSLEELAKFQRVLPFEPAKARRFTLELLEWEAEHFVEWAILKNEKKVSDAVLDEIRNFLKETCSKISQASFGLTHRDYHSKNLMVLENEKRIGIIDFQDALQGPPDYDLASLLRDSYVTFTDEEEADLISYYESVSKRKVDPELFGLVSIQRNLKAWGRFFYIYRVKGKDTHLPYVKPTMNRVFRSLGKLKAVRFMSLLEGVFADDLKN